MQMLHPLQWLRLGEIVQTDSRTDPRPDTRYQRNDTIEQREPCHTEMRHGLFVKKRFPAVGKEPARLEQ